MKKDIIIVGVGGQGILLASRVLGRLAMDAGLDIKVSEVHGMSQRGGDVITHVRVGEKVLSPLVTEGEADAILSFELMEAARALPFLREGGRIVVNSQKIEPVTVKIAAGGCWNSTRAPSRRNATRPSPSTSRCSARSRRGRALRRRRGLRPSRPACRRKPSKPTAGRSWPAGSWERRRNGAIQAHKAGD